MAFDKTPRFKDPFSSTPAPKAFYFPSSAKNVDSNVAIQSSWKNTHLSKESNDVDTILKDGSQFIPVDLPLQVKYEGGKPYLSHDILSLPHENCDETLPQGEQTFDSTGLYTSHLTSSIDDKDNKMLVEAFQRGNKVENREASDAHTSVLQRYIDRFRHSAPKPREERQKENFNEFWWLNLDIPRKEVAEQKKEEIIKTDKTLSLHKHGTKLTKEAVLELDKETSDLQQKADTILSRSQLSLASSGPCVSTDGLGSSSVISDYSFKSDVNRASYRPVFVHEQEDKYPSIQYSKPAEHEIGPGDALARWRMRRKTEPHHGTSEYKTPRQHVPTRLRHKQDSEMDVKLEEFRRKLFAQRALVTSEEIQFERKKMQMLVEDAKGDTTLDRKNDSTPRQNKSSSLLVSQIEDPVLARIRKTQSYGNAAYSCDHSSTAMDIVENETAKLPVADGNCSQSVRNEGTQNQLVVAPAGSISSSHNNALDCKIDEIKSLSLCDGDKRVFVLGANSQTSKDTQNLIENDNQVFKDVSPLPVSHNKSSQPSGQTNQCNAQLCTNTEMASDCQKYPLYHQRLQAEKPCADFSESDSSRTDCGGMSDSLLGNQKARVDFNASACSVKDEQDSKISQSLQKSKLKFKDDVSCLTEKVVCDVSIDHQGNAPDKLKYHKSPCQLDKAVDKEARSQRKELSSKEQLFKGKPVLAKSPCPSQIQQVIGETVVDHLFDRPSMISSVDSWASLFPLSPNHSHSQSMVNSHIVTPPKPTPLGDQTTSTPNTDENLSKSDPDYNSSEDSSEEFSFDPLMKLLLQQRKEYLHKLMLIESKLQLMDTT